MVFEIVEEQNKELWNSIVDKCPYGDILQFWQWGEVKIEEGWRPIRAWLKSPKVGEDEILIIAQILVKKAPGLGSYMYIPHGPIFNSELVVEQSHLDSFIKGLTDLAIQNSCFVVEIEPKVGKFVEGNGEMSEGLIHFTNEKLIQMFKTSGFKTTNRNMQPEHKLLYDLNKSEDELLMMMKKNTRYNVRYAEKNGVEVVETSFDSKNAYEKLDKFYELMLATQARTGGYPIRPKSSFKKLIDQFKNSSAKLSFMEAIHEGDTLSMNISQKTKNWASSFYAGSIREKSNLKASYLMRWKSVQAAKEFGSKVYDFWGFIPNSKQHEGYSDNKLSFGGTRIDHVGIMAMPLNALKYNLWNISVPLRRKVFELIRIFKK